MRHTLRTTCTNQRGIALLMALMLLGLFSILATTFATTVRIDTVLQASTAKGQSGFYAAEAGLNVGMAKFANLFEDARVPAGADFDEQSVLLGNREVYYALAPASGSEPCPESETSGCYTTIPAGEAFAGLNTISYRYLVKATSVNAAGDAEVGLGAEFDVRSIPIFQFLAFYANDLEILPGPNMQLSGRIHTNGNLYLNAGETLSIGDRPSPPAPPPGLPFVHVSAAQAIYRGRKDTSACSGTVIIDKLEDANADNDLDPLGLPCSGGSNPVPQATLDAYMGSLLSGVDPIQAPPVDVIARGGEGKFWQHADVRMVLNLTEAARVTAFCGQPLPAPGLFAIEVQNTDGSRNIPLTNALWGFMCERRGALFYTDMPSGAVQGSPDGGLAENKSSYHPDFGATNRVYRRVGEDTNGDGFINANDSNPEICPPGSPWWKPPTCTTQGTWFEDADYRRGGYYNFREGKWMYLLNVNVRALIEWNEVNGGPVFPVDDQTDGGLVFFVSVQGPLSDTLNNYGVRIFDAADLDIRNVTLPDFDPSSGDPTGLTVVSDQAVYLQGNYNYYATQTPGQKQPAAVIGDSLNLLSQSWERPIGGNPNDRKSLSSNLADRRVDAADAPFGLNAAFLFGVDDTVGSTYGGGFDNYLRLHEDWSARTLIHRGSYISLGPPRHVNGPWSASSYGAPLRAWDYDTDLHRIALLPPLTPRVTYVQQRLYTRFYE